ncbi:hypothetical protein [Halopseudomonas pachastrellae]|uniref:hypothetical protein n=1 Tax=Halopseudomonas pachastrellae TaxID=254161 RepID=UPI0011118CB4|nr:hypothetical protein [Halopseudomonas pachastrellae]
MKTAIPDDSKEFCRDINIPPLAPGEESYYAGLVRAEGNDRLYELAQFLNYLARFRNQDIIEEIDPRLHVLTIKKSKSLSELRKNHILTPAIGAPESCAKHGQVLESLKIARLRV